VVDLLGVVFFVPSTDTCVNYIGIDRDRAWISPAQEEVYKEESEGWA
jgi:hypothetical protein